MKRALLLSVVASTMIMAGGDIEPVAAPVVAEESGWDFSGTAKLYYQTDDAIIDGQSLSGAGTGDLFKQDASAASAGIQLRATNKDLFAGIGAGVEVSGLATLGLQEDVVSNVMQGAGFEQFFRGGWISQAYLTYGMGNTSFKLGRQTLPKALSPFAYSENWNVFENTYDAALVVNTDLPDTTLVGAYVKSANQNGVFGKEWNRSYLILSLSSTGDVSGNNLLPGHMAAFDDINDQHGENGVWMLTAQNKSIENLTLTGSLYYAQDFITTDPLTILWGDAAYDAGSFGVAVQGGTVMHDAFDKISNKDDIVAFGGKLSGTFMGVNAMLAYSNVNDGGLYDEDGDPLIAGVFNVGGTTSALYTNTVANQLVSNFLEIDADKFVVSANADLLGGNISGAYAYTDSNLADTTNEFDLVYSANLTDSVNLMAAYVYVDNDNFDGINVLRVVGSYKF